MPSRDEVVSANRELHAAAALHYREEPHYRPENVARVKRVLADLHARTDGRRLLDVGCGMGFILDIAKDFFQELFGVDVTPEMLGHVARSDGRIPVSLQMARIEELPFRTGMFDMCTAHAVLHHLAELAPVFAEVFRVLRPGGIFFSDLDPNYFFWDAMRKLPRTARYGSPIEREVDAVVNKDQELAQQLHLSRETVQAAEHLKHVQGGFRDTELQARLTGIGFSRVDVHYEWFF